MKSLNPSLVLDPTWICQSYKVDLEYYTYLLLGAQQTYLKSLASGQFDHFYEIVFHYLNLNTIIADSKIYDSRLKSVTTDHNLMLLISQLAEKEDSQGKDIIRETSKIFADTMNQYLDKLIVSLDKIHFYFNNSWILGTQFLRSQKLNCPD